jgi:phosphatidylserine decarboxylase
MRIPLTPYGVKEMLLYGGGALVLAVLLGWFLHPLAAVPPVLIGALVLYFFRDPRRVPPADPRAVVAPADGRITDVDVVDRVDFLGVPARRIGIFLSVFDVHLNRAPIDGEVVWTNRRPGRFLNVLNPESLRVNESNWIGIRRTDGLAVVVRQVSGAIARRIVCPLAPRAVVARGQDIGMIKLGSRTEFYIPLEAGFEPAVKVGDRVRAGKTTIGFVAPAPVATEAAQAGSGTAGVGPAASAAS